MKTVNKVPISAKNPESHRNASYAADTESCATAAIASERHEAIARAVDADDAEEGVTPVDSQGKSKDDATLNETAKDR